VQSPGDVKVILRDTAGRFLSRGWGEYGFTTDRERAVVFDYQNDRIAEQLLLVRQTQGLVLEAVAIDPKEFYETCDGCERLVAPVMAFFDGREFRCPDCRKGMSSKPE
jgi:hypothetical protein